MEKEKETRNRPFIGQKVYRIRITGCLFRPNIWYAHRIGQEFDAILKSKGSGYTNLYDVGFEVARHALVHPSHCEIISERVELQTPAEFLNETNYDPK